MKMILPVVMFAAAVSASPVFSQDITKDEIKQLALEAILENPEIVMQAVEILREQERADKVAQAAAVVQEQSDLIFNDPNAVVLGNPDGDVTIVEFFDYNCGYCKRAVEGMHTLLETDPNLRVVMREFPILSDGSIVAAKAALAAREQGKYQEFHFALMAIPQLNETSVMNAASEMGLDLAKLEADMQSPLIQEHLDTTRKLTEALGFTGTPSFIIGDEIVPGFIPLEAMQEVVAEQRAALDQ